MKKLDKKGFIKSIFILISTLRLFPHISLLYTHKNKDIIHYEIFRWLKIKKIDENLLFGFLILMTYFPEFRNLFYYRTGAVSWPIRWLCPKMNTLFIDTRNIGPGLYIDHGFSTIIGASSIGRDCWINQQVTIGYHKSGYPELGDNVTVYAGAILLGGIKLGNNSTAGAKSFVIKDLPPNSIALGVPSPIILDWNKNNSINERA